MDGFGQDGFGQDGFGHDWVGRDGGGRPSLLRRPGEALAAFGAEFGRRADFVVTARAATDLWLAAFLAEARAVPVLVAAGVAIHGWPAVGPGDR